MRFVSICEQWEGRTVDGKFPLLEWLGGSADRGVFLTVRQGIQTANIKLILASGSDADGYLEQWEAAKALSHPDLVQVMETGRYLIDGKDMVYVVTERAEGVLSGIIPRKALEPSKARAVFHPVLDALAYVHEQGFVHGSVRPSNILLVGDRWKLSGDSPVAAGGKPKQTQEPGAYDAPEVATGKLTAASDVWSLGMTMTEALAQQTPAWESSAKGDPVMPPLLTQPFLDIARKSLRRDPIQRCSIAEMKTLLGRDEPPPLTILEEPEPVQDEPGKVAAVPQDAARARWAASEPVPEVREQGPTGVPAEHVAYPFGKVEPVEPVRMSRLFSDIEEEEERRIRVAPIVFGVIVLLAVVAGYFVVRGYRIKVSRPAETQSTPAAGQPAQRPQEPTVPGPEGQPAPATEQPASPGTQSAAAPGETQTAPSAAPVEPQPQASPPNQGVSTPSQPEPQPQAPAASTAAPRGTPEAVKPEKKPEPTDQLHPASVEGAVVKRVLPNVAPGASESMRAPVQVEVRVWVNEDGAVSKAEYMTHGPGNYFARTARQAALEWKFRAPEKEGHARSSEWTLRFYFERRKTDVTATQVR
jgi:outer membrane biosynthesis protein TonB